MSKFTGVAYWKGALPMGWQALAIAALAAVPQLTLAEQATSLSLSFPDGEITIVDTNGSTQGIVPACPAAGALVVCLVAVRKSVGTLQLVDDAQEAVPTVVRQSNPLYAEDWARIFGIAEAVGLVAGSEFKARHSTVLNALI